MITAQKLHSIRHPHTQIIGYSLIIADGTGCLVMAELVSKTGTNSIDWDCFGLELGADGKTINDSTAIC